jgi:hypothetical protein
MAFLPLSLLQPSSGKIHRDKRQLDEVDELFIAEAADGV